MLVDVALVIKTTTSKEVDICMVHDFIYSGPALGEISYHVKG
jgi:hypothetical protein